MKRSWIVAIVLLVAMFSIAAGPYFHTLVVRTYLNVQGKAVISDSLRVNKTTVLNGALTLTGAPTITGDMGLTGKLVVSDSARIAKDVILQDSLVANGDILVNGRLVTGAASVLTFGALTKGTASFSGADTAVSVTISGAGTGDYYLVCPTGAAGPDSISRILAIPKSGSVVFSRNASTAEANQSFFWFRFK